jgi:hypothetical protein
VEGAVTPSEIAIWWAASIILIGIGILSALRSGRRQTYLASLAISGAGTLGMLYSFAS